MSRVTPEELDRIAREEVPYVGQLGVRFENVGDGEVTARLPFRDDLLRPGGTITGCPKVRCMEIIHELESGPRGAYTGSMGWLGADGALDLNILIRSMELGPESLAFRAGAGIVFDSDPAAELAETRAKAKGLLLALEGDA